MEKNRVLRGAVLLAVTGAVCKAIGALYRIPLANLLGAEGMADYQAAYPVYAFLLVLSTGGLPVAISKLVAERDEKGAARIMKTALMFFAPVGALLALLLFIIKDGVAGAIGLPSSSFSIGAIAPSLFFATCVSVLRGYFQGKCDMRPSAASQLTEQVIKLFLGLFLAYRLLQYGPAISAAGAMAGVTAGEAAAFLMMMFVYMRKKTPTPSGGKRGALADIMRIALPVTISAAIVPIEGLIDSALVMNLLMKGGMTAEAAKASFGLFTGYVCPIANMPCVITMAINQSLLPSMSEAAGDMAARERRARLGMTSALAVGSFMTAGLFFFGGAAMRILYPTLSAAELASATELMRIDCLSVILLSVIQVGGAVLHGTGHTRVPLFSMLGGLAVKVGASFVLIPQMGIKGAALGSVICFVFVAAPMFICTVKMGPCRLSLRRDIAAPAAAVAFAAVLMAFSAPYAKSFVSTSIIVITCTAVYAIISYKTLRSRTR